MNSTEQKLTKEELAAAREWIADCCWPDLEPEDVEELTDDEVERGIRRHFEGGLDEFKLAVEVDS